MRYHEAFRIVVFTLLLISCRKTHTTNPHDPPPSEPVKKVLNPGKETFSAGPGLAAYTINYTYNYNSDHSPSSKAGDLLYTAGADAGKKFQTNTAYTYY